MAQAMIGDKVQKEKERNKLTLRLERGEPSGSSSPILFGGKSWEVIRSSKKTDKEKIDKVEKSSAKVLTSRSTCSSLSPIIA